VVRRFNEIGFNCHLPRGSFYAFPSISNTGLNEIDFCHRLLREQEVAVVPGTAFGDHGVNHVRASFSTSYDKLVEATDRIEKFVYCLDSENNESAAV
jgi:aminotransferase